MPLAIWRKQKKWIRKIFKKRVKVPVPGTEENDKNEKQLDDATRPEGNASDLGGGPSNASKDEGGGLTNQNGNEEDLHGEPLNKSQDEGDEPTTQSMSSSVTTAGKNDGNESKIDNDLLNDNHTMFLEWIPATVTTVLDALEQISNHPRPSQEDQSTE